MADKKKGYVPVYRSMQDNWVWKIDEPFDARSAWIDLLLTVNHKEEKIPIGRKLVIIKPGQTWTSYKKLANRWGWTYKRVLRYINMLKSDGMVYTDGTPNGTLLTVRNWAFFNTQGDTHGTPNATSDDTPSATPSATSDAIQTIMNNNDNNEKEKKIRKPKPPRDGTQWQ